MVGLIVESRRRIVPQPARRFQLLFVILFIHRHQSTVLCQKMLPMKGRDGPNLEDDRLVRDKMGVALGWLARGRFANRPYGENTIRWLASLEIC